MRGTSKGGLSIKSVKYAQNVDILARTPLQCAKVFKHWKQRFGVGRFKAPYLHFCAGLWSRSRSRSLRYRKESEAELYGILESESVLYGILESESELYGILESESESTPDTPFNWTIFFPDCTQLLSVQSYNMLWNNSETAKLDENTLNGFSNFVF